jgi:hypothetical protein
MLARAGLTLCRTGWGAGVGSARWPPCTGVVAALPPARARMSGCQRSW